MALFKRKQKTDTSAGREGKAVVVQETTPSQAAATTLAHVLRHPRITEKASFHSMVGVYLFDVAPSATKHDIEKAVFAVYKVKPRLVRVVTVPSKRKRSAKTGRIGIKQGGKKAYVYLKKGETITITQ